MPEREKTICKICGNPLGKPFGSTVFCVENDRLEHDECHDKRCKILEKSVQGVLPI